jgi:hypothetical protein
MRRVIVVGVVAMAAMVVLLAAAQAIDFGVFNLRLHWLDADHRLSVFGVASLLAQVSAAAASATRGARTRRHRSAWLTLAVLIAALVVGRTETVYSASELAVPLVCVFGLICWLTWSDCHTCRMLAWGALVVLAISVLLHQVGVDADASPASDYTWHYQILGIVKHGAELAGWTLMATAIAAGIAAVQQPSRRPAQPRPSR